MTESSFCFNFLSNEDSNNNNDSKTDYTNSKCIDNNYTHNINNKSNDTSGKKSSNTPKAKCQFIQLSSITTTTQPSSYENITIYPDIPPLKKISASKSVTSSADATTINNAIVNNNTDIIPGVYEGGLKVWECSLDICNLLSEQLIIHKQNSNNISANNISIPLLQNLISKKDLTVLELGCGHALPSCFLLHHNICTNFLLLDYNEFVLQDVTLSNMILNLPSGGKGMIHVGLLSGDWNDISQNWKTILSNKNKRVDCIIASETIYTKQHTLEMIQFLLHHLELNDGIGIIATKRYYFGCGGGTNELVTLANDTKLFLDDDDVTGYSGKYCKLDLNVVKVIDNGMSNIREIILVRCIVT